jgi:predicted N-formylglutamate amidohydrolase
VPERHLLLTCEHGGNRVPTAYRPLFAGRQALLRTHRGWDGGALRVAKGLAQRLRVPLFSATTSRLLVDLNRSPHNPAVFSEFTQSLPPELRERLLRRYHTPHWEHVRRAIRANRGVTLHVGVHSFTPVWKGAPRAFPIGILYDTRRARERAVAIAWQRRLREHLPTRAVRRNAPYRGGNDGLTTALRRELRADRYLGIEIELNQGVLEDPRRRRELVALLAESLAKVWPV